MIAWYQCLLSDFRSFCSKLDGLWCWFAKVRKIGFWTTRPIKTSITGGGGGGGVSKEIFGTVRLPV